MEKRPIKLLALKDAKGYGNKKVIDLISSCGSLDNAFLYALKNDLIEESKIGIYEKELNDCKKNRIQIITYFDKEYPLNLRRISSPPLVLFAKGNLKLLNGPPISIVGTREASKRSLDWTYNNSKELSDLGYVIVSGGALGTDTFAHKGTLSSSGNTICVLGSGINNIYPNENEQLVEEIFKRGLVISECLPDQKVNRFSLLERNRITSGLGNKLLLVATKLSGGAMSQYNVALSQGKEIYCPHPDLRLEPMEGIKHLIKENKEVNIISNIQEILKPSHFEHCKPQGLLEPFV